MTCLQYVQWLRKGHRPSTSARQSEKVPLVRDKRWVNIDQWYPLSPRMNLWVLFRPPRSGVGGWASKPDEMERSAVVECEVVEFADFLPVAPLREPPRDATNGLCCRVRTFRLGLPFTAENWREFPHQFEMKGWVQVKVLRVVPLLEIPLHFPEGEAVGKMQRWKYFDSYESKSLILESGYDDEANEWRVRTKGAPSRVVLRAFEVTGDAAEICNEACRG